MMQKDNEIILVKMQPRHIKALAEIERLCFTEPWSKEGLAAELNNPHSRFIVALKGDTVSGYVGLHYFEDTAAITNIAVHPDFRHQGIASRLLSGLFTFAREKGIREISLEVRVSNENAITLYKKHGFIEAGIRKNLYTHPCENGIVMIKNLLPPTSLSLEGKAAAPPAG